MDHFPIHGRICSEGEAGQSIGLWKTMKSSRDAVFVEVILPKILFNDYIRAPTRHGMVTTYSYYESIDCGPLSPSLWLWVSIGGALLLMKVDYMLLPAPMDALSFRALPPLKGVEPKCNQHGWISGFWIDAQIREGLNRFEGRTPFAKQVVLLAWQ